MRRKKIESFSKVNCFEAEKKNISFLKKLTKGEMMDPSYIALTVVYSVYVHIFVLSWCVLFKYRRILLQKKIDYVLWGQWFGFFYISCIYINHTEKSWEDWFGDGTQKGIGIYCHVKLLLDNLLFPLFLGFNLARICQLYCLHYHDIHYDKKNSKFYFRANQFMHDLIPLFIILSTLVSGVTALFMIYEYDIQSSVHLRGNGNGNGSHHNLVVPYLCLTSNSIYHLIFKLGLLFYNLVMCICLYCINRRINTFQSDDLSGITLQTKQLLYAWIPILAVSFFVENYYSVYFHEAYLDATFIILILYTWWITTVQECHEIFRVLIASDLDLDAAFEMDDLCDDDHEESTSSTGVHHNRFSDGENIITDKDIWQQFFLVKRSKPPSSPSPQSASETIISIKKDINNGKHNENPNKFWIYAKSSERKIFTLYLSTRNNQYPVLTELCTFLEAEADLVYRFSQLQTFGGLSSLDFNSPGYLLFVKRIGDLNKKYLPRCKATGKAFLTSTVYTGHPFWELEDFRLNDIGGLESVLYYLYGNYHIGGGKDSPSPSPKAPTSNIDKWISHFDKDGTYRNPMIDLCNYIHGDSNFADDIQALKKLLDLYSLLRKKLLYFLLVEARTIPGSSVITEGGLFKQFITDARVSVQLKHETDSLAVFYESYQSF